MRKLSKESLLIITALSLSGISLTVSIILGFQVIKLKQDLAREPFPAPTPTATPIPEKVTKPAQTTIAPGYSREIIEIKFVEGSEVRLRGEKLVSLSGQDLSRLYSLLSQYPILKVERLFTAPEEKLEEMKKPGGSDLNLWYRLTLENGANTGELIKNLGALAIVEKVEPAPLAAPPPGE